MVYQLFSAKPLVRSKISHQFILQAQICFGLHVWTLTAGPIDLQDPSLVITVHDHVNKWKHFLCYWPFVQGIHRSPVNSPHKGQWQRVLMFSLICTWTNAWVNNSEAGDWRRHHTHYVVTVMSIYRSQCVDTYCWSHRFIRPKFSHHHACRCPSTSRC